MPIWRTKLQQTEQDERSVTTITHRQLMPRSRLTAKATIIHTFERPIRNEA